MWSYFSNLSPVIMGVVGILVFFSLGSWAIMAWKALQIRSVRKGSRDFLDFFWETRDFAEIDRGLRAFADSPIAAVFQEGYRETRQYLPARADGGAGSSDAAERAVPDAPLQQRRQAGSDIAVIDTVGRSLRKTAGREAERLERNLSFLATTGSVAPFIGLFGTVWGIMLAFRNIGQTGSTSLDVVAPGISEALVTTAIGLVVAIPAVVGFNFLQGRIKALVAEIECFSQDFLAIVRKAIADGGR